MELVTSGGVPAGKTGCTALVAETVAGRLSNIVFGDGAQGE
jgi:hypothetical protein